MAQRRTSFQDNKANDDVPLALEGLSPMNVEGLYSILEL